MNDPALDLAEPTSALLAPAKPDPSTAFLDSPRGIASFYVLIHHAWMTVYNGYYLQKTSFRPPLSLLWMGDVSYTLYVVHMPLLVLFGGLLMAHSPAQQLPRWPIWVLPAAGIIIPIAWFLHLLAERPFVRPRTTRKATVVSIPAAAQ